MGVKGFGSTPISLCGSKRGEIAFGNESKA